MHVDEEIRAIEARMAWRRHEVADSARALKAGAAATKDRALRRLISPAGLAVAAGLGFVVTAVFLRRPRIKYVDRRSKTEKAGKIAGIASLVMPLALAAVRSRFGGPVEMAQYLVERFQERRRRATATAADSPNGILDTHAPGRYAPAANVQDSRRPAAPY